MAERRPQSGWSCRLLTPLSIPGRIDFPWMLNDVKGVLALWCQHSVISLSLCIFFVIHHSPFSFSSPPSFYPPSLFLTLPLSLPVFLMFFLGFSFSCSLAFPQLLASLPSRSKFHSQFIYEQLISNNFIIKESAIVMPFMPFPLLCDITELLFECHDVVLNGTPNL